MSLNPSRSRQGQIAALVRQARSEEAANRIPEAISLLREVVQLDPHDSRTLHRLGDLFRIRLNRLREAASWYAREARVHEREDLPERAIAAWRIVLLCHPLHVEAHEHVGSLYAATGRLADARQHYDRSERVLREAGLGRDASILRAQREALGETEGPPCAGGAGADTPAGASAAARGPSASTEVQASSPPVGSGAPAPGAPEPVEPEDDVVALANERLSNGRLYHHYGLHADARRQLEELLALFPEHVEARQLLAEVCRTLGDGAAAAHHLGVLVHVMRRQGEAPVPEDDGSADLPPVEEWDPEGETRDPFAEICDEIRGDVERLVDRLRGRKESE